MMKAEGSGVRRPQAQSAKKRYEKPLLRTFGTLTEVTQNVGPGGAPDGGMAPTQKTH